MPRSRSSVPSAPGRESDRETAARPDDHRALRLWLRMLTCTQLIERQVRNQLRLRFSTTLPRFDLMSQLERHPEGLKMNELSRRMMVTGGNITGITDQLVKEGLVERRPLPADRRAYRIKLTRAGLTAHVPLIGFAGSPFTLFSYLVAGKPSKEFSVPRAFAQAEPEISARLMEKLADAMIVYLRAQAKAGAQALMLFESWGGLLGPSDFRRIALPPVKRIMEGLKDTGVPLIYFANQCGGSLAHIATLDVDVIGLDWRTSLGGARKILGESKAIQGNLDPAHLFSSPTELKKRIDEVFADIGPGPGHIFNLGHGIWPETDPDSVARLVDYVYEKSAK